MAKHEGGFFWGVLLGAVAAAIAGSVILSRSCQTFMASGATGKMTPQRTRKPKNGKVRRVAAKK